MSQEFKPDLGFYFKENVGDNVANHFYKVLIFEITLVGHNLYSFTTAAKYGGREFSASFDFTIDKLKTILKSLTDKKFVEYLSAVLLTAFTRPEKVDFRDNPIQADIVASLGQPVKSLYEEFIPFIIEEINNIKQNV